MTKSAKMKLYMANLNKNIVLCKVKNQKDEISVAISYLLELIVEVEDRLKKLESKDANKK